MMRSFKVWSGDRKQKKSVAAESLEDLKQKGCEKLGIKVRKHKVVDETDGTEIEDDEFLNVIQRQGRVVMILRSSEEWTPRGANQQTITTSLQDDSEAGSSESHSDNDWSDRETSDEDDVGTNRFKWSKDSTKQLIAVIERRYSELNSPSSAKKQVWENIGAEMLKAGYKVTGKQCESKWKGLKLTFCRERKSNGPQNSLFFESMKRILGDINPPATTTVRATGGHKRSNEEQQPSCSTTDTSSLAKKRKAAAETEDEDEKHQERKTTLLDILGKLTQLVEKW